jgi:hypothetical protein
MKRILLFATALMVFAVPGLAQDAVPEPTQSPDATYRLFRTLNIYTQLKLDTRTGQVWQLQWGDGDHRFVLPINLTALMPAGSPGHPTILKPGRFTLCPDCKSLYLRLARPRRRESVAGPVGE